MNALQIKISKLNTKTLINTFKGLEDIISDESNLVNEYVMIELENRMNEEDFINLLDEVYED